MEAYTLTITADSRPGLLHLVTGIIEKKLIRIISFWLKPTEMNGTVKIMVEILIDVAELKTLILRLKNIIEVYSVTAASFDTFTMADTL